MRILIAEDDRPSRELLEKYLTAAGYDVAQVEDGQRAWEALQRERFRILISGWTMAGMTGPDLIRRVRAELQSGYVYCIIVTAVGEKSHVEEGLSAGADDYISKPYRGEELLARVKIGDRILHMEDRLREAREQTEYQAMHDGLTGLLNRRAIQDHAEAEVKRAARTSALLSVLLMDLDRFKSINDRFGHSVGDQALRMFAEVLLENIRLYDWAGRWGGEEFLCVLPGTTLEGAKSVAERVRANVEDTFLPIPEVDELKLTVSIGVANASGENGLIMLDSLVRDADQALNRAKREGRNRVCVAE